jgi:hypothetical protein
VWVQGGLAAAPAPAAGPPALSGVPGSADGWERFAPGTSYDVVGMIRGDRDRNEPEDSPWVAWD